MRAATLLASGADERAETFHLHVDSVGGNDSSGTGYKTNPYATITKALSVATAGQSIGLKAGSVFREAATLTPSIRLRFGKYGLGADPIMSGGAVVTGWSQQITSPYVQRIISAAAATNTSFVLAVAANTTAGNMVVAAVKLSAGVALSSVTDSKGNSWTIDKTSTNTSGGTAAIAHAMLTSALTTSDTITFTPASACSAAIAAYEYTSISPNPADVNATANGSGTTASAGPTGTTAQADEVVVSVVASGSSLAGLSAPAGYTERDSGQTANAVDLADKAINATGTQTAAWTIPNVSWATVLQAYKMTGSAATNIYAATLASTPAFVSATSSGITTGLTKGSSATTLTANQWFYTGGRLYVNLNGTDPATVTIEAAIRGVMAATVAGAANSVVRRVEFRHGFDRMVRISNSNGWIFDRCTFRYAGFVSNSGSLSADGGGNGVFRITRSNFDRLMNDGFWWAATTGGVEADNNTFTNIGYLAGDVQSDGLQCYSGFGVNGSFYIHHNHIDMSDTLGPKGCIAGPEGNAGASVNGAVIEHNTLIGGAYGWGGNASDLTLRYNTIRDTLAGGGGIQVDATGGTTSNLKIYRNLLVNCTAAGLYVASSGPALVGFVLANNTVVDCHGYPINFQPASVDATSIIQNNLVWNPTVTPAGYVKAWPTSGGLPATWSHNLFPSDTANSYQYKGTNYASLSAWQTATGVGSSSIQGQDPLLDGGYKPTLSSPALDGGVAIPGITDGYLGGAPDIGYVEVS